VLKDAFLAFAHDGNDMFGLKQEPIFDMIMSSMVLSEVNNLIKKQKILVPYSGVLIGVVDEAGFLNEGEVFVQIERSSYRSKPNQNYDVQKNIILAQINSKEASGDLIEGDVLVTKNPCQHPGDIRKLKAVDCKQLRHLFNVVVFSRKGSQPDQNKMSGGDLDGDVYTVIWDGDLVSNF